MKVNTDQLRKLATTLNSTADAIDAVDVRSDTSGIAGALPGCSDVSRACVQGGEFTEGAYLCLAGRQRRMAGITTDNANNYQATDERYATELGAMGATIKNPVGVR